MSLRENLKIHKSLKVRQPSPSPTTPFLWLLTAFDMKFSSISTRGFSWWVRRCDVQAGYPVMYLWSTAGFSWKHAHTLGSFRPSSFSPVPLHPLFRVSPGPFIPTFHSPFLLPFKTTSDFFLICLTQKCPALCTSYIYSRHRSASTDLPPVSLSLTHSLWIFTSLFHSSRLFLMCPISYNYSCPPLHSRLPFLIPLATC